MSQTQDDKLHEAQRQIVNEAKRFNVVDCGRRFGKTILGINRAKQTLRRGQPVAWFAPTYKLMTEVFAQMRFDLFDELSGPGSKTEMRLEMRNGGVFEMWTLDDMNAGRGRKYARIIVDEAAMVKNLIDAWSASIRPTLTDLKGDAWFLSTPKGRNGFWELYQLGLDAGEPDWACWQMPTVTNPYIDPDEVEAARCMLPERIYSQEYQANFIEDSGGVFRRIMEAATAEPMDRGEPTGKYIYGIDWARTADFTVFIVIDAKTKRMVAMDRFNQINYALQMSRLKALRERFPPASIIAEENSMGSPLVEKLQREDRLPVRGFVTTNATKADIIEGLALSFERGEIQILNDNQLVGELMAYDQERLPSGLIRYGAPSGSHDDCVMALALAWYGASQPPPAPRQPTVSMRTF